MSRGENKGFRLFPLCVLFPIMKDGVWGGARHGPAKPDIGTEVNLTHIDLSGWTESLTQLRTIPLGNIDIEGHFHKWKAGNVIFRRF